MAYQKHGKNKGDEGDAKIMIRKYKKIGGGFQALMLAAQKAQREKGSKKSKKSKKDKGK